MPVGLQSGKTFPVDGEYPPKHNMEPVPDTSGGALSESQKSIPGAQSKTVHQILAYLANSRPNGNGTGSSYSTEQHCTKTMSAPNLLHRSPSPYASPVEINDKCEETRPTAEELFRLIMSDHQYLKIDLNSGFGGNCDANTVPNAADIQKFFLETINLIAFKPMKDTEAEINSTNAIPPNRTADQNTDMEVDESNICQEYNEHNKTMEQERRNTLLKEENERRKKERQLWASECRTVLGKVQHNSFVNHAVNLLEKYWKRYLATPLEEINHQVVETAHELNLTDDVIEMLQDKTRYVWQIIEEMPPRDLKLPF